ncbi:Zinc finger protein 287 [Amphibalanus amphitrite]|uniref:Zinc finger protein 287 n=1 Tax=Amphibalanus amphitrite TaxID=1232801 RepID=A0A6A4VI55_AMPAM|nr:Zinc finger protein 287 [Amphibalanus amphitrite]
MSVDNEPEKPAFLQCCLVCNVPVPAAAAGADPERATESASLRQLLAGHISTAARDELDIVESVCAPCLATLQQWNAARLTVRRLHQALAARYRCARQRRAACVLSLHLERLVVQIPYGAFLLNARGLAGQPWPELVRRVAAAVLESAGIARPARTEPPPPAGTRTVGCQTPAEPTPEPAVVPKQEPEPATVAVGTEPEPAGQPAGRSRPAAARRPRGKRPRSALQPPRPAEQPPPPPPPPPLLEAPRPPPEQPSPRPLLGCLRGWEGITNVQPSAPQRPPAASQKRVGFEGLKEQAARARDLEETLSILSVADTASLLDRTETLSVFSDTADLSTLADENWPSLEVTGGTEPDMAIPLVKERPSEGTMSVSFAEPSGGGRRPARRTIDRGEDLLREFAETMSNISEGVVLEDLEGYFEEIDRPFSGGGRPPSACTEPPPAPAPSPASTAALPAAPAPAAAAAAVPTSAVQCPVCQKQFRHRRFLRPHLRLHDGSLFRCERCDAPFLHYYKLQLHLRRRHGVALRSGRAAAGRPAAAHRRDSAGKLSCADCGRRFTHLTTLRQHERLHRGGGYRCEQCGKTFPSKSELSRHADGHRPEKLYKCEDCGKAFQVSTSLARHRTLHTDRASRCDLCGKEFDRKDTMLRHRETHKASNEHSCHICGKMYKQRRILVKHVRLMHGPATHVCEVCKKAFRTNYEMMSHARKQHAKAAQPEGLVSELPAQPA